MNKPNVMESVQPGSGQYSWKTDLRLNRWFFVATVVWVADLALLKQHPEWSSLLKGVLALAPLIPGLFYVWTCVRFIRGLDELQRGVQLEAFLFAALGTVIVGAAINTLSAHGVPLGDLSHGLGLGATVMVMFTLWLVGGAIANCRYK